MTRPPIQARLPLVVGGSGKKRTLRIVARYADWWNADGDDPQAFAALNAILDEHCAAVGRDPTVDPPHHRPAAPARPRRRSGKRATTWPRSSSRRGCRRIVARDVAAADPYAGPLSALVDRLAAFEEAGASMVVFDWPAPSDPGDPGGPRRHHLTVRGRSDARASSGSTASRARGPARPAGHAPRRSSRSAAAGPRSRRSGRSTPPTSVPRR